MAQLVCTNQNCRVVLMYPRGATQVQCSVCHTINCSVAVRPHCTALAGESAQLLANSAQLMPNAVGCAQAV